MNDNINNDTTGYFRLPKVLEIFPISKSSWWEGVKNQRYPQPVKLGPRITVWRKKDIYKLLENTEQENTDSLQKFE